MRIEAMALLRRVGPVHPIAVKQSRTRARHIAVPDAFGVFRQGDAFEFAPAVLVEETELDALRVRGEKGEIWAAPVDLRAQRIRAARFYPCRHAGLIRWWARGRSPRGAA